MEQACAPATATFDDNLYIFGLLEIDHITHISVSTAFVQMGIAIPYEAVEKATYGFHGTEMKVTKVHPDYVVLLVKPLQ